MKWPTNWQKKQRYKELVEIVNNKKQYLKYPCVWLVVLDSSYHKRLWIQKNYDENMKWESQLKHLKQNHYEYGFLFVKRYDCEYNMK